MKKNAEIISSNEFEKGIKNKLINEGFEFISPARVGNSSIDFYIETPTSGSVILELKYWKPTDENIEMAQRFADEYKSASGADYSFLVFPTLGEMESVPGILTPDNITETLRDLPPKTSEGHIPEVSKENFDKRIFASMPFSDEFVDTFVYAMQPACREIKAKCIQLNYEDFTEDSVSKIHEEVSNSYFIIADISESRPSVLYEVGFAKCLGKKIIQICSTDKNKIPFVVRNNNTIFYTRGNIESLVDALSKAVLVLDRKIKEGKG